MKELILGSGVYLHRKQKMIIKNTTLRYIDHTICYMNIQCHFCFHYCMCFILKPKFNYYVLQFEPLTKA